MHTIASSLLRSPLRNRSSQILKHRNRSLPIYACIRDTDALFQRTGALGGDFLIALFNVGFDHDADDAGFAFADLVGDDFGDFGLVAVVFVGVA